MLPCNVPNRPHTPNLGMESIGETLPMPIHASAHGVTFKRGMAKLPQIDVLPGRLFAGKGPLTRLRPTTCTGLHASWV